MSVAAVHDPVLGVGGWRLEIFDGRQGLGVPDADVPGNGRDARLLAEVGQVVIGIDVGFS